MFRKVLVANRGEIAARVLRACRKLGVESVAVYSWADRDSPHLALADETIAIGGPRSSESYLDARALLQAAIQSECQAIHPGYGFLSENALFARRCEQQGTTFIGPPPEVIELMGNKSVAKRTMKRAGLPVIPGSEGAILRIDEGKKVAREIGFPVLLKASSGGGGKGMRLCREESAFDEAFAEASMEADKAFGDGSLYLEKYIEGGRHIEFQVLADAYGHVVHLGERECSLQRNHQKLMEEAPSPALDDSTRKEIGARVCKAVSDIGYRGAGTVEFLRDDDGGLYFLEMNARLQVEHPVTEMITGIDLVAEQLKIAANVPLAFDQDAIELEGHAIECRINAEDPLHGFRGAPGKITQFVSPEFEDDKNSEGDPKDWVRLDTHIEAGYTIPPFYDSMIGKLIVKGRDRMDAIDRMNRALGAMRVEGVPTTIQFQRFMLQQDSFRRGDYSTSTVPEYLEAFVSAHASSKNHQENP